MLGAYAGAVVVGLLVVLFMSVKCLTAIWLWLSLLITLCCVLVFAVFCHWEYEEVIKDRCYNGIEKYGCGGVRSTFFYFMRNLFVVAGGAYIVGILFFARKVKMTIKFGRSISRLCCSGGPLFCLRKLGKLN
jgi:hypothetical protein